MNCFKTIKYLLPRAKAKSPSDVNSEVLRSYKINSNQVSNSFGPRGLHKGRE